MKEKLTYKCAGVDCGMEFLELRTVMPGSEPQFGSILLCGGCGRPSTITLEGTRLLTEEEFEELPQESKNDLRFAQRSVQRKVRQN